MKVALLTREYPPEIYGGAGVHVDNLAAALRPHTELAVHCFGAPRTAPGVTAYGGWEALAGKAPHLAALRTMATDLLIAAAVEGAELVHSHTWYANLAGHLAKLLYGVPHVMTTHSLEPLRPWKAEQLGGGYALSTFCERTAILEADAIVAVSRGMKDDILAAYPGVKPERVRVIHNGVDPQAFTPDSGRDALSKHGLGARPYAIFVGRVTRQKGIVHLLEAAPYLPEGVQLVCCAGEADSEDIARDVKALRAKVPAERLVWIEGMVPRQELVQLLTHARLFVCPSVYEPFGIVNLEAMACGAPVVASAVGGIPEIVVPGKTGLLVPFTPAPAPAIGPKDPARFAQELAAAMTRLFADEALARSMGQAGRARVVAEFSWTSIAEKTAGLYRELVS